VGKDDSICFSWHGGPYNNNYIHKGKSSLSINPLRYLGFGIDNYNSFLLQEKDSVTGKLLKRVFVYKIDSPSYKRDFYLIDTLANPSFSCSSDNHYFFGGNNGNNIGLVKYDSLGTKAWLYEYSDSSAIGFRSITSSKDSGVFITGTIEMNGNKDIIILKIDKDGNRVWRKRIGWNGNDYGNVKELKNGNLLLYGETSGFSNGSDLLLCRLDSAGDIIWQKIKSYPYDDKIEDAVELENGDFVIVGARIIIPSGALPYPLGYKEGFIIRLNSDGDGMYPLSVETTEMASNKIVAYPNPTNSELKFDFNSDLPLHLALYNSLGQEVTNTTISSSQRSIDVSWLQNGCYFYHLSNQNLSQKGIFFKQ
jgi:hypothetical protein